MTTDDPASGDERVGGSPEDPAPGSDVSVVELLDRVLERGVVVHGDVVLSVADVDLVRLSVSLLLAAEDTARGSRRPKGVR